MRRGYGVAPQGAGKARTLFRRAFGQTFRSLRHRNFRLFFIGQLISNTGNWLTNVALVLLVLRLTGRGVAVGVLSACQFGPLLFLGAWAGAVADRSDKRRLLLLTQSLEMAQSAALAVMAFMPHPPLAGLYVLALAGGVFLAFDNPLRRSFVSEMVPAEDVSNGVVLYSTIVNLSRIFGPTLAGALAVAVGFGWCFTLDAASYIAVLACLLMMRAAELHRAAPAADGRSGVREGLRYVRATPFLWISFLMLAAIGIFTYNLRVILPLYVTDSLHRSDVVFTLLYSVFSAGGVAGALMVAHRSLVRLRHITLGAAALGAALLLLASMPTAAWAAAAVFAVGVASILYMTGTTALAQVDTRPDMHGRVLALQTVLIGGTALAGGPFLGWLADTLGGRAPIVLGGLVCLAASAWGYAASANAGHE
jgi:MFS family permease